MVSSLATRKLAAITTELHLGKITTSHGTNRSKVVRPTDQRAGHVARVPRPAGNRRRCHGEAAATRLEHSFPGAARGGRRLVLHAGPRGERRARGGPRPSRADGARGAVRWKRVAGRPAKTDAHGAARHAGAGLR